MVSLVARNPPSADTPNLALGGNDSYCWCRGWSDLIVCFFTDSIVSSMTLPAAAVVVNVNVKRTKTNAKSRGDFIEFRPFIIRVLY